MVLVSITAAMVDAITFLHDLDIDRSDLHYDDLAPDLEDAAVGRPIAHTQVIALSKLLRKIPRSEHGNAVQYRLDDLLRGSRTYYDPSPKPKTEPVSSQAHSQLFDVC